MTEIEKLQAENERLRAENTKLKSRLKKCVELPFKKGDIVYWVHCSYRIYRGEVLSVSLGNEGTQVFLELYSPDFKKNNNPSVFMGDVFSSKKKAQEFVKYCKDNLDNTMCTNFDHELFATLEKMKQLQAENTELKSKLARLKELEGKQ